MRIFGATLAIVALLGVGACAKAAAAPTNAEYAGMANQVCRAAHEQALKDKAGWAAKPAAEADPGARQRFVRFTLVKHYRDMALQLRTVPPPDGDSGYLESIFVDWEHALDLWYSDPLGPTSKDAMETATQRMANYGLTDCATVDDDAPAKT